jgi:hypothetical protein
MWTKLAQTQLFFSFLSGNFYHTASNGKEDQAFPVKENPPGLRLWHFTGLLFIRGRINMKIII